MNEPSLTDAEHWGEAVTLTDHEGNETRLYDEAHIKRIVAARVVEAVDRERAAWVAKAEALAARPYGSDDWGCLVDGVHHVPAPALLALLSADDTEGKP